MLGSIVAGTVRVGENVELVPGGTATLMKAETKDGVAAESIPCGEEVRLMIEPTEEHQKVSGMPVSRGMIIRSTYLNVGSDINTPAGLALQIPGISNWNWISGEI